jgi:7,8-dihydroneopterin aldolase/epimerase/oxygenase
MDWIRLTQIRCYGFTGFLPEEQVLGQWFEVDLAMQVSVRSAGLSDRIEDTLDYRSVISRVQTLVQTSRFALVERLAEAIATSILEETQVQEVQVQLHKLHAPIPDFNGRITIDITRRRTLPSPNSWQL